MLKGNKDWRILNLGCGNGQIQDRLYQSGYHHITNNDISAAVISQMAKLNPHPAMTYEVMDATKMAYPDGSFDLVLDKSTIDALLCSDSPLVSVARMVAEVERVLKCGGVYFVVSYGEPDKRLEHLQRGHVAFDVEVKKLYKNAEQASNPSALPHFLYVCRKNPVKQVPKDQFRKIMRAGRARRESL